MTYFFFSKLTILLCVFRLMGCSSSAEQPGGAARLLTASSAAGNSVRFVPTATFLGVFYYKKFSCDVCRNNINSVCLDQFRSLAKIATEIYQRGFSFCMQVILKRVLFKHVCLGVVN